MFMKILQPHQLLTLSILIAVLLIVSGYNDAAAQQVTPVSDRTPQVRDAIVADAGVPADEVTEAHLAEITTLDLEKKKITSLKAGDFDGLTNLRQLYLRSNQLSALPLGIFDDLTKLNWLWLDDNQLSTLPSDIFDNLTQLTWLYLPNNRLSTLPSDIFDNLTKLNYLLLGNNRLSTLPSGIFDNLTKLTWLVLDNNQLSTLPSGIFDNLTKLTQLYLDNNQLSTLPPNIFAGLTELTRLWLQGNAVDPLLLPVSLEAVGTGAFKAVASTGAPFDIVLPLVVSNGSLATGATTVTISKGQVESTVLTVNRTPGTSGDVSVNIGVLPGIPTETLAKRPYHQGYALTKSGTLPLVVISGIADPPPPTDNPPVFTEGASTRRTIAENTAAGTNIGSAVAATDADGDTLTYTLGGTDAAAFSIVSTTGQLRTQAALDYETKSIYTVAITASDGSLTDTITVTINVTDIDETPPNRAPVFIEGPSTRRTIAENTAAGTNIGSAVAATDADGDTLTYTLSGTDAAAFSIVSTTGQLRTQAALNYETKSIYAVAITASDGSLTDTITVTINVTDIDETPPNRAPVFTEGASTTRTVAENTAAGTNIGNAVSATDADGDTLTCTLGGTDAAAFSIVSTTAQLRTRAALDYETKSIYTVTITASDGSLTDTITVTINVTDIDEAPPNRAPVFTEGASTTRTIAENTAAGTNIGSAVAATDADGDTLAYTLGGTDAAAFSIVSTTGQLRTQAALDYETKSIYTVIITASDGSLTDTITVTINVTDIDEAPPNRAPVFTEGASTTRTIAENTAAGTNIGSAVAATDADGDTLAYTLGGTDAAAFSIVSTTGQLRTQAALDYETKSIYTVTITASDGSLTDTINVTINVTDIDRAPVFTEGASTTRTVAENTAAGTNIGSAISATDADGDTLTYTLSGTDAAAFSIVSTTGQLRTQAALNAALKSVYFVTVTVSDGVHTVTISVIINVTDGEMPPVLDVNSDNVVDITDLVTVAASFGATVNPTYPNPADVNNDGVVDLTDLLLVIGGMGGVPGAPALIVIIGIADPPATSNHPPVFTEGASTTRTVAENTAAGTNIGSAISATDADGDTLTYTLSGTDAAAFSIVSTTGQLRTQAALNAALKSVYFVTVTVSDGVHTVTISVIINVTDGEMPPVLDVNSDNVVDITDLVTVAASFGATVNPTYPNPADVNNDGVVDLTDLLLVIGGMESTGGVPGAPVLSEAKRLALGDATFAQGIAVLEQLLDAGRPTPKETLLLSNYPNPFNPETWIPYQLATDAEVTVTIYDVRGVVVRELVLGHRPVGLYHSRARAAHWDGRNTFGEKVASGIYFYIFTAGDFTATRKMLIRK